MAFLLVALFGILLDISKLRRNYRHSLLDASEEFLEPKLTAVRRDE